MMRRQPQPSQFVVEEWRQAFDIVTVEPHAAELPSNLDVLVVAHPQNVSPQLQFAIDQFLLGGKPVFLAVDPSSQHFKRQSNPQAMMMGGGPQNVSSDLPQLLEAYGISYDSQKVVGDLENATQVQTGGGGIARYPIWLSLRRENFNAKALPTAQLSSTMFVEPGSITLNAGSPLTFTPLIETSSQAGDIPSMMLQFAQPDDVSRQITPTGRKTIAALVTGKFKTAFPDGAPKEDAPPNAEGDADHAEKPVKGGGEAGDFLKESKGTSTLFVIADTDWLFDDYSLRKFNFFGQTAAEPFNDNLALAANTVEYLGGSQDLITIRGKGTSLRPFTVVRKMEAEAQKKYQEKLAALDAELSKLQADLSKLQGERTTGNRLVATPEMAKRIEDFQKQQAAKRAERREIRRALREDIDRLENRLLITNLISTPLLVALFGMWFYRARRR
jgi:ABC-type uncharacterized transport system involved in gliding motility auxiliary subunit